MRDHVSSQRKPNLPRGRDGMPRVPNFRIGRDSRVAEGDHVKVTQSSLTYFELCLEVRHEKKDW